MTDEAPKNRIMSGSHPAVRFEHLPMVDGPLNTFNDIRSRVLKDVADDAYNEISKQQHELLLSETLFLERQRIRRNTRLKASYFFTYPRTYRDKLVLRKIHKGLLASPAEVDRSALMLELLNHYADEIGGHFRADVYRFSTLIVPWMFNWLVNAASVRNFIPWQMTENLQSNLRVVGEVTMLQKLAKRGTILLVPTHQSNVDSMVIGYVIYLMSLPPFAYGAGLNLFSNPVLSYFMRGLGAYTVDRQKSSSLYKSILKNYSTRILTEGVHSVFFPGGGRSRSGAIESQPKLGLLGTGLQAQIMNMCAGKAQPNIYIVPMVSSYDFVLEATSLIEDYLSHEGKHRFLSSDSDMPLPFMKSLKFLWKLFASQSGMTVRIGRAMDVFGNFVDEDGRSMGPNGLTIDVEKWLRTCGELRSVPQRDREYTRELGKNLVDSYYRENVVVSTHLVAFAFFTALRKKYPELDLYKFLRLSLAQRSLPFETFMTEVRSCYEQIKKLAENNQIHLSDEMLNEEMDKWVQEGIKRLGVFHEADVLKVEDGVIFTEDMNLVYYYRNRLTGYGLACNGERGRAKPLRGECDEKGFLA